MALITGIATADIAQKPEFQLTEQQWYDKYVRPNVQQLKSDAFGAAGAGVRGAKQRQGQLVSAQLGGEMSSLGEAAVSGMAPTFRKAMQRAMMGASQRAEALTREKMLERNRKRAEGLSTLGTVTNIESGLANLIPFAGPVIAGATQVTGGLAQAGLSQQSQDGRPLSTVRFDEAYGVSNDPRVTSGGGGLYDLYNLTYG